jgi:hypothetical protein
VPVPVQAHTKSVCGSLKSGRPMPAKNLRARNTNYAARYFDPNRRIAPSMDSTVVTLLRSCAFPMFTQLQTWTMTVPRPSFACCDP